MDKKQLIYEILQVIVNFDNYDPSNKGVDQFDEWGNEIYDMISNWVNKNNVNDVEFTVSKQELEDVYGDYESINNRTSRNIIFLEDYCELQDKMHEVFDHYEGPGWDGTGRCDDRWNENYFFTGSDCTHYVLVKKLN